MPMQVAPILSAFAFVAGCAVLRLLRQHARALTPLLAAVALALFAGVLLVVSLRAAQTDARALPALPALTPDGEP
ncbi:hypothetical protein [Methylobacterium sp. ID0610]|uniref:hypothetical protein n=1 Tax=Methylobacterium carpenticola TaxID=3344827 RepID=UPI00368EC382